MSSLQGSIASSDSPPLYQGLIFMLYHHVFSHCPSFSRSLTFRKVDSYTISSMKFEEVSPSLMKDNPVEHNTSTQKHGIEDLSSPNIDNPNDLTLEESILIEIPPKRKNSPQNNPQIPNINT